MFDILIYDSEKEKAESLSALCKCCVKKSAGESISVKSYYSFTTIYNALPEYTCIMLYMLRKDRYLGKLSASIRKSNDDNYIVLVVSCAEEMFGFMGNDTKPAAILPVQANQEQVGYVIDEIYADYSRLEENQSDNSFYSFRIRSIDYKVSFRQIIIIEVQSKKITLRTAGQIFEFYDSLESVMSRAPDYFLRVHRSFVVNTKFIDQINYSEKTIYMNDGSQVFFSRSYSPMVKKYMSEALKENIF
ncbi:MAG: LytTR family DNA-binding domain-containing protein [Oscillospiraceae bacterium]|nr:LytTR family DNA-binding domain-containing protein [Oscillospiraceae bacterium]